MLGCIAEIGMLIWGIKALVTGKLNNKPTIEPSVAARVAGAILMLPLPLAFGIGLIIGVIAASGNQGAWDAQQFQREWQGTLALVELGCIAACAILAMLVAQLGGAGKQRRRADDEDDLYSPRRYREEDDRAPRPPARPGDEGIQDQPDIRRPLRPPLRDEGDER